MRQFVTSASCMLLAVSVLAVTVPASAYRKDNDGWEDYRSRHFIIYHKGNVPRDFLETIASSAEHYYEEITSNLGFSRYKGWTFDERAQIYIYESQEDYVISSQMAGWSHGAANARTKVIRTFPAAHGFFDSTLPHELGHIIFREFVGFHTDIPLWMDEGVAMYQERARRWGANQMVQQAIRDGSFISLKELGAMRLTRDTPRDLVNLFYAEAASIVYYLITEEGEYRFVNFCKNIRSGKRFESALTAAYRRFDDIDDLNRAWMNYLERK